MRRRHFLVSAIIPYCYIVLLGVGLLVITLVSAALDAIGKETGLLLYLLGVAGEIFVLTSIYLVMPLGRLSLRHALISGVTAALLWELTRHILVWYFATLSQVQVVYGSLTTAIVVLLSLEIGAGLLLLGAQVISEYERLELGGSMTKPPKAMST